MTAPLHLGSRAAKRIVSGDANLCIVGDSLSSHANSPRNIGGIIRTWDVLIKGMFAPGRILAANEGVNTFVSADPPGQTTVEVGTNWPLAAVKNDFPMVGNQIALGVNYATNATIIRPALIKATFDLAKRGNWLEAGDLTGRWVYFRTGAEPNLLNVTYRRETSASQQFTGIDLSTNGSAGTTFIDRNFPASDGAHASNTDMFWQGSTNDESGTTINLIGTRWWRTDITNGLQISSIARGGWGVQTHLDPGADANGKYTDVELENYMTIAGNPNIFMIQIGQNDAALSKAQFKTHLLAVIARYKARASAVGTVDPLFLLVSTWDTASDNTRFIEYAEAMAEISTSDPSVDFNNLRRRVENKHGAWATWQATLTDGGVHQKDTDAADEFMSLVFEGIMEAILGLNRQGIRGAYAEYHGRARKGRRYP